MFSKMKFLALIWLTSMAAAQSDQSLADLPNDAQGGTIVVNVWAPAAPASAKEQNREQATLSRNFAIAGLKAAAILRDSQRQLAYGIQNGYPLAEFWIHSDRDRAREAVALAALSAEIEADRQALQQLVIQNENLGAWTDWLINQNRNLRLANYYMSSSALDNDALFQKTVSCTRFLIPMFASGRVAEDYSCR